MGGPFAYHEHVISGGAVSKYCDICNIDGMIQDAEHIVTECPKFRDTREIIFGPIVPPFDTLTDKQISEFIDETMKQDFPWFPPEEGEAEEEDHRSVNSEAPLSPNVSISEAELSVANYNQDDNPGYDLFDTDSEDEHSSNADNLSYDEDLDHYLLSPNAIPDPEPYQGNVDSDSSDSNINHDEAQFLLNAEDMYSEIETESETDSSNSSLNDFEIVDEYIDDEPIPVPDQDLEPNPNNINFDPDHDSDLDHYFVGPDGVYLEQSETESDDEISVNGIDPAGPSPGPFDPG